MKRDSHIFLFSLITSGVCIFSACSVKSSSQKDGNLKVIHFEEATDSLRLAERFKDIDIVQLEMTEDVIVGNIKRIADVNGEFILLTEDNEILVFDRTSGKYLRKIGEIGESPEEYLSAVDFYYDPGEVIKYECN